MARLVNPKRIAPIIALLVIASLVVIVALALHSSNDSKKTSKGSSVSSNAAAPTPAILNPTDVVKQLDTYTNKRIALKGTINEVEKKFYVVGDGQPSGAVRLDFSKTSVNPSQYANVADTTLAGNEKSTIKGPATVIGTLVKTSQPGDKTPPYSLVVSSIK
jgi:hypothetical protein